MKYETPKISNEVHASSEQSSIQTPIMGFIPKGLSKITYKIIESFNKNKHIVPNYFTLYSAKDMSKEEIFNLSKELSDYNIGRISTYPGEYLKVFPMKDANDYTTDYRILVYHPSKQTEELPIDIANMAKDGFRLVQFSYISESKLYAAKFIR